MTTLKVALDWTPNINHIGFFVAKKKGFYSQNGLEVEIVNPQDDEYQTTPAKKVELGLADFALCPMESIISYRTKKSPFPLVAIAAIFQEDLSAIAVRNTDDINSPKDLDGKSYASYKARYEDQIIKKMIQNDGGKGTIQIQYPNKLGIWETVQKKKTEATWIFMNWEGVQARNQDLDVLYFKMKDYNIPYSYSPVIAANEKQIELNIYKQFLEATKKGFMFAKNHPKEAIDVLTPFIPEKDRNINLHEALATTIPSVGNTSNWGIMKEQNVKTFLNWIYTHKLESKILKFSEVSYNILGT